VVEKLSINEISEPLLTSYGWHIFKLTDTRGASVQPYESLRNEIQTSVVRAKVENHLKSIKQRSLIEIVTSQ